MPTPRLPQSSLEEARIRLARHMLNDGAGHSAKVVLSATYGRSANNIRVEAKTATIRGGLWGMGLCDAKGILIPLRAVDGPSSADDAAYRAASAAALKEARSEASKAPPNASELHLDIEDICQVPYGSSIGLASALAFYQRYENKALLRPVIVTGCLLEGGHVGAVEGMDQKLAAVDAETYSVRPLVVGPQRPNNMQSPINADYETVRTFREAIAAAFEQNVGLPDADVDTSHDVAKQYSRRAWLGYGLAAIAATCLPEWPGECKRRTKVLRVGVSSESSSQIKASIDLHASNFQFEGEHVDVHCKALGYLEARSALQDEDYDVVMLDDPWFASFCDSVVDLKGDQRFAEHSGGVALSTIFMPAVVNACHVDSFLVGLPFMGNVQLLVQRSNGSCEDVPHEGSDHASNLFRLTQCLHSRGLKKPLGVRAATSNDLVEVFWEILRAHGYVDKVDRKTGAVIVDRDHAEWTREKLIALPGYEDTKMGGDDWNSILDDMWPSLANDALTSLAIGWPNWFFDERFRAGQFNGQLASELKLRPLSERPVMGIWALGVRKTSKNIPAAIDLVWSLATNTALVLDLTSAGVVPVLNEVDVDAVRRRSPLMAAQFDTIRQALAKAVPRPRSVRWIQVEDSVASMIRSGEFTSIDRVVHFK